MLAESAACPAGDSPPLTSPESPRRTAPRGSAAGTHRTCRCAAVSASRRLPPGGPSDHSQIAASIPSLPDRLSSRLAQDRHDVGRAAPRQIGVRLAEPQAPPVHPCRLCRALDSEWMIQYSRDGRAFYESAGSSSSAVLSITRDGGAARPGSSTPPTRHNLRGCYHLRSTGHLVRPFALPWRV